MHNKSSHILNTSSNLLGFTFLVLSSIKGLRVPQVELIEKTLSLCIALFACSSFLSFVAIRTKSEKRGERCELYADYAFLVGIFTIAIISVFFAFGVVVLEK